MSDYETHLLLGSLAGLNMGAYTFLNNVPYMAWNDAIGVSTFIFAVFCVGAVLPDIDSPPSKPRSLLPWGLMLLIGGSVYLLYLKTVAGGLPISDPHNLLGLILGLLAGVIAAQVIPPVVDEVTVHRRFLHFPPLYGLIFWVPGKALQEQALTLPGVHPGIGVYIIGPALIALFWGTVVHCLLDGLDFISKTIQRYRSHPTRY